MLCYYIGTDDELDTTTTQLGNGKLAPKPVKLTQRRRVQFQFRKRYRKVDWKLLGNVDVDKITRDLDYHALQANIMNVAFCDTKSQDFLDVDEDFIKLYRLGQYTIEYLLHCQTYLSHGTVELEAKLREAIRFRNEVKEKLETKQKELTECKKESRKRKKMIAVYQGMLNTSGVNGFHKCSHCEKAFVSAPFLASHLERRHGIVPTPVQSTEDKLRIANEELEKQVQTLKDRVKDIEQQLKSSQESREKAESLRDSALQQQLQQEEAHKRWETETEQKHKDEVEKVKEIYLKEASEALEEKRIAELALVEAKKGIVSNLGALRDEKHEHDELRQEQITQLESDFNLKLSQLQQEVEEQARKLRNNDDEHRQAMEEAKEREDKLLKQLEGKILSEKKLQDILNAVELENAKLVQMNKEKPDIRATLSPAAIAQMTENTVESGQEVEVVQKILATQPVTELQESATVTAKEVPLEKKHAPFGDKPYIKTHYDHPKEAIDAARKELENDIAIRLLNVAGNPDIESLTNEEYSQYKDQIDRNRTTNNTSLDIHLLETHIAEICQRRANAPSPRASPLPTTLPPKSPSFKNSRESLSRPNSSKRTKTTAPAASRDVISKPPPVGIASENVVASTPKITPRSVEITEKQPVYDLDFDDDTESADKDVSEIELAAEIPAPRQQHVQSEVSQTHVRSMSDEDEEAGYEEDDEEEEDEYSDDNAFHDDELLDEVDVHKQPSGYSLRDPNYNPLDEDSEEELEEETRTPSPIPVVKRRPPNRSYKDEDDSIFSFDGWSKMKNRNSMSADDAQQNIPLGHVAKMRQAVDELNRAKRAKTAGGVSVIPVNQTCAVNQKPAAPTCSVDKEEEDDFTVSSLSERDLSPVGMKVDIKRSSRNGVDDVF